MITRLFFIATCLVTFVGSVYSQQAPYDKAPDAEPPYYRVRYEASEKPGELIFPVRYTIWIPEGVKTLRGVVVHQHGCGEGSCKSGLTGAYDLHWQSLARENDCALLSPSYEQPQQADCQMWCDPRNGSGNTFLRALKELGQQSQHPELATVPWALWGHSGGGHWAGGIVMLYPDRVAAAWLRSGVPMYEANPERPLIKPHDLPNEALRVPIMCNPGTKEGVTDKEGKFARVWPANEKFFYPTRAKGGLVGIAVDPLTAHECGNQRYLAIQWLDACLKTRLPKVPGQALRTMPKDDVWLASVLTEDGVPVKEAVPAEKYKGDSSRAIWLPNEDVAKLWMQYVNDTDISDTTAPPPPSQVSVNGSTIRWKAIADPESGIERFIVRRDGKFLSHVPKQPKNKFGRPLFQGLQYSDTPAQPLNKMQFTDPEPEQGKQHTYEVLSVNTAGLKSAPTAAEHQSR